jgi:hypothetical protein
VSDEDESTPLEAAIILGVVVAFAIGAYFANDPYEIWSLTAPAWQSLLAYYFATQPIYAAFLILFTYQVYKQDESLGSAIRGFVAAVLAMVSLDIMGLPYAVMSLTNPHSTLLIDRNAGLSPFADWIIINYFAGSAGIVTFMNDVFTHVGLPIILIVAAYFIARPGMFVQIVARD